MSMLTSNLQLTLESPEQIRERSAGEVRNPDGCGPSALNSSWIFGNPWQWQQGDWPVLARKRHHFGHIELAMPVLNPLFRHLRVGAKETLLSSLLGMSDADIQRVISGNALVLVGRRKGERPPRTLYPADRYRELLADEPALGAQLATGPAALRKMLSQIDLNELILRLQKEDIPRQPRRRKQLLRMLHGFQESGAKLEWLVLEALPVIPLALRNPGWNGSEPFNESRLGALYRAVVKCNNLLKKLRDRGIAPAEAWIRVGDRLQRSVDRLFLRQGRSLVARVAKTIRSLRRNRVELDLFPAAKLPVVPNPELALDQCGLPRSATTLELFAPALMEQLCALDYSRSEARQLIRAQDPGVWDILEEELEHAEVLVKWESRLRAFRPVLTQGEAAQLAPLMLARKYDAPDWGDAIVYAPRTAEGRQEALEQLTPVWTLLSGAAGQLAWEPSDEMVLAVHVATANPAAAAAGEGTAFGSADEVRLACEHRSVTFVSDVSFRTEKQAIGEWSASGGVSIDKKLPPRQRIDTTPGRVLFNDLLPASFPFFNRQIDRACLQGIVFECVRRVGHEAAARLLDRLQQFTVDVLRTTGPTLALADVRTLSSKPKLIAAAHDQIAKSDRILQRGLITQMEHYNKVLDIWTEARSQAMRQPPESSLLSLLIQVRILNGTDYSRLCCWHGIVSDPEGHLLAVPILSNFSEGFRATEYWMVLRPVRRGNVAETRRSSKAARIARTLARALQELRITEYDCKTSRCLKKTQAPNARLEDCLRGRMSAVEMRHPLTHELVVFKNQRLSTSLARGLAAHGLDAFYVRSPLTCEAQGGICQVCYGDDVATRSFVGMDAAVGLKAAAAIGLKLQDPPRHFIRYWNEGWPSSWRDRFDLCRADRSGTVRWLDIGAALNADNQRIVFRAGRLAVVDHRDRHLDEYAVPEGAVMLVEDGAAVSIRQPLFEASPHRMHIVADVFGTLRLEDCVEPQTCERMTTPAGATVLHVRRHTEELRPRVVFYNQSGEPTGFRFLPVGSRVFLEDGATLSPGVTIAVLDEPFGTRHVYWAPTFYDILQGEPRQDTAILAPVDGTVRNVIADRERKQQTVVLEIEATGEEWLVDIPTSLALAVWSGDKVSAGEALTRGSLINPHDVLRICGYGAAGDHLLRELVRTLPGNMCALDEKHLELVIRQMLSLYEVNLPGDTPLSECELVNYAALDSESGRIQHLKRVANPGDSNLAEGQIITETEETAVKSALSAAGQRLPVSSRLRSATVLAHLAGIDEIVRLRDWPASLQQLCDPEGAGLACAAFAGRELPLHSLADRMTASAAPDARNRDAVDLMKFVTSRKQRGERLATLERLAALAPDGLEYLLVFADDEDAEVRSAAYRALARHSPASPNLMRALIRGHCQHRSPGAAATLKQFAVSSAPAFRTMLEQDLESTLTASRLDAVWYLQEIVFTDIARDLGDGSALANSAGTAFPPVSAPSDQEPDWVSGGLLGELGVGVPDAMRLLARALENALEEVGCRAAQALAAIAERWRAAPAGPDGAPRLFAAIRELAAEPLLRAARHAAPQARVAALRALDDYVEPQQSLAIAVAALHDPDDSVRLEAARGVHYRSPIAESGLQKLSQLARSDHNAAVRCAAAETAWTLAQDASVIPPLVELWLRSPDSNARQQALAALGKIGRPAAPAVRVFLTEPDPETRAAARELLDSLGV